MVPFHSPTPFSGEARSIKDTQVVFAWIPLLAAFFPIAGFQQVQDIFQAHDVECLVVACFGEPAADQLVGRAKSIPFEFPQRQSFSLARNEMPVETFGIAVAKAGLLLLGGRERREKLLGRLGHGDSGRLRLHFFTPQHDRSDNEQCQPRRQSLLRPLRHRMSP